MKRLEMKGKKSRYFCILLLYRKGGEKAKFA
jgi:hypothetical protein